MHLRENIAPFWKKQMKSFAFAKGSKAKIRIEYRNMKSKKKVALKNQRSYAH